MSSRTTKPNSIGLRMGTLVFLVGSFVLAVPPFWPARLAQGNFHRVTAEGAGVVTVERGWLGRRSLRLSGMDLALNQSAQVRLIAGDDAFDDATAKDAVSWRVGQLRPAQGAACLPLQPEVDLNSFRAVVLWSDDLQLNLMTAPLHSTRNFSIFWNR